MSYELVDVGWTDDRINTLARMWKEGASAGQIGRALGITRNAAMGKINRLHITRSDEGIEEARSAVRRIMLTRQRPRQSFPEIEDEMSTEAVPLEDLRNHHCRWPIGDPRADGFGFCGKRTKAGASYCADHAKVAFTTGEKRPATPKELARALRRHITS